MGDMRRLAVEQSLHNAEKMGDADRVKRLKKRLKEVEAASAPEPAPKKAAPKKKAVPGVSGAAKGEAHGALNLAPSGDDA